jgi:hypothetical protein
LHVVKNEINVRDSFIPLENMESVQQVSPIGGKTRER